MKEDLISIIVPVYKVEEYLDECVQSIVNQTYQNLEIILVDDGSPDRCPQMCDAWAQKDARIKVIHKENGGASAARNAALNVAKGEYIGFVDSDDYIKNTMFETLYAGLKTSEKGISYCYFFRVKESGSISLGNLILKEGILDATGSVKALFNGCIDTAVWSKLFKSELFRGIRFPEGETNEEFPILLPLVIKAGGIACTGETMYYYRERKGSVTGGSYMREDSSGLVYKNLDIIARQMKEYDLHCKQEYAFFAASYSFGRALAMEKKYPLLSQKVREDYRKYRGIMWKNMCVYLCSRYASGKDKVLYCLVLSKLLRPSYRIFYKDHL